MPWWTKPSRFRRSPAPISTMRSTVDCSSTPARIVASIASRERLSMMTDSMPHRCIKFLTCVLKSGFGERASSLVKRTPDIVRREPRNEFEHVPLALRLGGLLRLVQVHWMNVPSVHADLALPEYRVVRRHRLHRLNDFGAIGRILCL